MDLNADLGESFGRWSLGDDEALLAVVTSANVACGFHAGDAEVMLRTCRTAAARGVAVGAHVSYRDLVGFGRHFIDLPPDRLFAEVAYQIAALQGIARIAGTRVRYVKPHGALYNTIVHHEAQADAVVRAVRDTDDSLAVLGLAGSVFLGRAAAAGLATVREAFADRAYRADGTLLPRSEPGAVLHDPDEVVARLRGWIADGRLEDIDSICVHGDSPGAVDLATRVRGALTGAGVALAPFAP